MIEHSDISSNAPMTKDFNWQLIAKKAKTERDLAFLRKREQELKQPVVQIYGSLDSARQQKLQKLKRIIASKEAYLVILSDAVLNH